MYQKRKRGRIGSFLDSRFSRRRKFTRRSCKGFPIVLPSSSLSSCDSQFEYLLCFSMKDSTELEHYAYPSVESFIEKHNRYSNWESQLERELDGRTMGNPLQDRRMNFRRRLKRLSKKLPMRPLLRFWYIFFVQRGFLDGLEGYYFAQLHACYEWMSVIKTFERGRNENRRLGD